MWIFTEDPSKNSQRPRAHCSRGGWPTTAKKLPTFIWPYWSYCGELSIEDSLIMKGHQIVILQVLQGGILCKLHASHQSRKKTKLRACTSVFWRNLNKDIEDMTKSCKICQELQPKKAREPLLQTKVSPWPWHTLETDIFYLDSDKYLLIADHYTKYPFVRKVPKGHSTSKCVVDLTKQVMRSDNGHHYQGRYHQFSK